MNNVGTKTFEAMNETLRSGEAFVLVDGQYGSTGKGLAASFLAEHTGHLFDAVTSNAGPNSGHTSYGPNDEKVVLQQLPTFGVISAMRGNVIDVHMNAGAIIDEKRLMEEKLAYVDDFFAQLTIHPNAAVVSEDNVRTEKSFVQKVGSTGKGTGAALMSKIARDAEAVAKNRLNPLEFELSASPYKAPPARKNAYKVFVEVSQGFSLSLNAGGFYPYCTSRDCTVTQAMSDAGLHPCDYAGAMMVVRTFPIRVAGNSGPCYPDQEEISWGDLGVEPEKTTVTNKIRRVFTWSDTQFIDALRVNRPNMLFFNFLNYLHPDQRGAFVSEKVDLYSCLFGYKPDLVLGSTGPKNSDVEVFDA